MLMDKVLIPLPDRARTDDRDTAFTSFVQTRGAALARTSFLIVGDAGRAEDVLQTALAETYLRWTTLRHPAAVEAYVRRVIVTTNAAWWRRRSSSETPFETLPDRASPDDCVAVVEQQTLLGALRQLSARQRAVIVLRYFDDLSEGDTAAILGCSPGSVKKHTSRALHRLRTILATDESPELTAVSPPRLAPEGATC
jgi:RNA polymerase sigma-70 factor (sigma-E family)